MNEHDYLTLRAERMADSAFNLADPIRKHEAQGIGSLETMVAAVSPQNKHAEAWREAADMALELVDDLCSPEGYGHAVPVEVVKRAGRIRAMLRPAQCGIGYQEPPPARCQHCDES
jgi:hypothetical protein